MPSVIIPAIIDFFISLGVSAGLATFAAYAVVTVAFIAGARALAPKPPDSGLSREAAGRQQIIRSSIATRRIIYGQIKVSGVLAYALTEGADNANLHLVIAVATHECNSVGQVYFNDNAIGTLDGSGNVTSGQYAGFARVIAHLGQSGQVTDAVLTAADPTRWTSAHVGNGICYLYTRLIFDRTIWPTGIPNITAIVQGKKVFDPRTSTTGYSTNPALCIRDYLTATYGLKATAAEIDDVSFIAAANTCDEAVSLSAGGSESRYTCNGSFTLDTKRVDVIGGLLASCAGNLTYSQGKYRLYVGAYRTPVVSLTESDLAGEIKVSPRTQRANLYNAVRGTYVDPGQSYQVLDFPPVVSATYQAQDGGEQIFRDIALDFVQSNATAQRIAKIWLQRSRNAIAVQATWKPTCIRIAALDNVQLSIARFGWVNKIFTVVDWRLLPTGSVIMTLQAEDPTSYAWAAGDQNILAAAPFTNLPNPFSVAAPTALALDSSIAQQVITTDGQVVSRIRASWTAPADTFVKAGGKIEVQAKLSTDSTWISYPPVGGLETAGFVSPVRDGASYDVRVRSVNSLGIFSAYVTVTGHVVVAKASNGYLAGDNMIPNANSELGADAVGLSPGGNGLVNDPANAFEGNWCRKLGPVTVSNTLLLADYIPVTPGDQYYFEGMFKGSVAMTNGVYPVLEFTDAGKASPLFAFFGANAPDSSGSPAVTTATYGKATVLGTVPSGKVYMRAYFAKDIVGGVDSGVTCYADAFILKRLSKIEHLAPGVAASVNSSWYDNFTDVIRWIPLADVSSATFVATPVSDSQFGGSVGRATRQVERALDKPIAFDPDVLYRIVARVRQVTDPASGTKQIFFGAYSHLNETDFPGPGNAPTITGDPVWYAVSAGVLTAGAGFTTYVGYIKGRSTSGVTGVFVNSNNPAAPSLVPQGTRFIRPAFAVNYNGGTSVAGGVVDIDQFTIEALANPQAWIDTGNLNVAAATTVLTTSGSAVSVTTAGLPFLGGPQDIASLTYTPPIAGDLVILATGQCTLVNGTTAGMDEIILSINPTVSHGSAVAAQAASFINNGAANTTSKTGFAMSKRIAVSAGVAVTYHLCAEIDFATNGPGVPSGSSASIDSYELKFEMIKR